MKRAKGRPPLERAAAPAPSVSVHVRLSAAQFDAAYARAQAERVTLGELFRRAVYRAASGKPK
jgi:hypothetical protein